MHFRFSRGVPIALSMGFALAASLALPARAVVISDTFTGTISTGTDSGNLFGGGSLVGQAFTGTLTFDTAQLSYNLSSGSEDYVGSGGSGFSISATVNNITVTSTHNSELVAQSAGNDTELTLFGNTPQVIFEFEALGPWMAGVINQPLVLDPANTSQNVFVGGDSFSITPTASAPAPEPASALILGSGLIALRAARRRKQV